MTMEWTRNSTCKLIDLFRQKPELWDSKNHYFKDRHIKREAWQDISRTMEIDRAEVEKKMRSVVGQYHRENRKVRGIDNNTDGVGDEEGNAGGYVSRWFAYDKLAAFLGDYKFKVKRKLGNRSNVHRLDENEERSCYDLFSRGPYSRQPKLKRSRDTDLRLRKKIRKTHRVVVESPSKRYHPESEKTYSIVNKPCNTSIGMSTSGRDEYAIYGEHVACKVRKLSTSYARSTAQYHINNILYLAALGTYDRAPTKPMHAVNFLGINANSDLCTTYGIPVSDRVPSTPRTSSPKPRPRASSPTPRTSAFSPTPRPRVSSTMLTPRASSSPTLPSVIAESKASATSNHKENGTPTKLDSRKKEEVFLSNSVSGEESEDSEYSNLVMGEFVETS